MEGVAEDGNGGAAAGGGGAAGVGGGALRRPPVEGERAEYLENLRLERKRRRHQAETAQTTWLGGQARWFQTLCIMDCWLTKLLRKRAGALGLRIASWANCWVGLGLGLVTWASVWSLLLEPESRTKCQALAVFICGSGWGCGWLGRWWLERPRPPLSPVQGPGHPSGHSVGAGLVLGLLYASCPASSVLLYLCAAWALGVGLGRVCQRCHWLADVAAGWALGFALAASLSALSRLYLAHYSCGCRPTNA